MKRNTIKQVLLFGLMSLFGITSMNAQEKRERPQKRPTFEQLLNDMDTNKDGQLSKKEVKGPLKKDFAKIDLDENGYLTKEELQKSPKSKERN